MKSCHTRTHLEVFHTGKRRVGEGMAAVFKCVYGCHQEGVVKSIYIAPQGRIRSCREMAQGSGFQFKIRSFLELPEMK